MERMIPVIVLIRAILLYLLVICSLRIMGKRQLGELQPSELVITILISNIASLPIEDNSLPMVMGVVPILVLVGFEVIISSISLHSKKFRALVSGRPIIVIRDGKIDQQAMKQLRFSVDDLMETLRAKSIFNIQDVQYAIVETTGQVNILQKHAAQTVTAQMLDLKGKDADPPAVVVSDGKVIHSALTACGLTPAWLSATLRDNRRAEKDIFLMTADRNGNYFIVPMENGPRPKGGVS